MKSVTIKDIIGKKLLKVSCKGSMYFFDKWIPADLYVTIVNDSNERITIGKAPRNAQKTYKAKPRTKESQ